MPEQATSEPVSTTFFDEHPALYDALIDWDKRLEHEGPFYRKVFKAIGVNSVLDAACGTGHHAAMFHSWGMQVEGADVSPQMIAHCRATFGKSKSLHLVVRSFDRPCRPASRFGAAVCIGNSLALAQDLETVHRALKALLSSVQSGGVLVIQVLNLWHVPEGETIWQKCRRMPLDGKGHILLKGLSSNAPGPGCMNPE